MPGFDDARNTFGFGKKYKNELIEDVPDDYLIWVLENCSNIDDFLRDRIKKELNRRASDGNVVVEDMEFDGDDVSLPSERFYRK